MGEEPTSIRDAVDRAVDAFDTPPESESSEPTVEATDTKTAVVRLRTACRLLTACRSLREPGGYHASGIELSFAAIEHSLDAQAHSRGETIRKPGSGRIAAFGRAGDLGLLSETTAKQLKQLHRDNRTLARTRDTGAAAQHATAMFDLAEAVHSHVVDTAALSHECTCEE
ncbi:hypothetical protein [Halonotius roseus]|uniref:DUF8154 domain-containing protein n=1 Tax=Halonotius roseus TaxID=2511997 RepID=A0A544QKZ1_9EURY|nr:hypothetical protein [Halonotius roseus]TQQ79023.1 hypothetical protein EWF95_12905 [Halonotius roseus]